VIVQITVIVFSNYLCFYCDCPVVFSNYLLCEHNKCFFFLILSLCNNDIIIVFLKPMPMCELILFQDICVSDCIYFIFHFDQR
jgi:hypothetical protein